MIFLTEENSIKLETINVIYFYNLSSFHHKAMLPIINKIEEIYPKINCLCIDVEYFKSLCKRFEIESSPSIKVIFNGISYPPLAGVLEIEKFRDFFDDIYNTYISNGDK